MKKRTLRARIREFLHWRDDHNEDPTLKHGVHSSKKPILWNAQAYTSGNSKSKDGKPSKSVSFKMDQLSKESIRYYSSNTNFIELLLDDGASYRGMELEEFKLIQQIAYPG